MFNKAHRDFEVYDRIEIVAVPRYKTSEMSGDEWRVSAFVRMYFKGEMIAERRFSDIRTAAAFLPGMTLDGCGDDEISKVLRIRDEKCDQYTCDRDWTVKYRIKQQYSSSGEKLARSKSDSVYYRKFCPIHSTRGDCGLEDADQNYKVIETRGEGKGSVPPGDMSQSGFGGVIGPVKL